MAKSRELPLQTLLDVSQVIHPQCFLRRCMPVSASRAKKFPLLWRFHVSEFWKLVSRHAVLYDYPKPLICFKSLLRLVTCFFFHTSVILTWSGRFCLVAVRWWDRHHSSHRTFELELQRDRKVSDTLSLTVSFKSSVETSNTIFLSLSNLVLTSIFLQTASISP